MGIYDIDPQTYNIKLAEALKKTGSFPMPDWAKYVKTGLNQSRLPDNQEWWYNRAASILRQISIHKVVGVGRLRTKYGGRKIRGMKPEKFAKASGKIIRVILQQAEAAGYLEKVKEGKRFGRRITKSGDAFLAAIK